MRGRRAEQGARWSTTLLFVLACLALIGGLAWRGLRAASDRMAPSVAPPPAEEPAAPEATAKVLELDARPWPRIGCYFAFHYGSRASRFLGETFQVEDGQALDVRAHLPPISPQTDPSR